MFEKMPVKCRILLGFICLVTAFLFVNILVKPSDVKFLYDAIPEPTIIYAQQTPLSLTQGGLLYTLG